MALDPAANFVRGSTTSSIDGSATTLNVSDASIYPDPASEGAYNIVVWAADSFPRPDQDPDVEIMRVTGVDTANDTLSVSRGEEGTVGAGHPSGSAVQLSPTAKMFSDIASRYTAAGEDFDGQGTSRFQNLAEVSTVNINSADRYFDGNDQLQTAVDDTPKGGLLVIEPGIYDYPDVGNATIKQSMDVVFRSGFDSAQNPNGAILYNSGGDTVDEPMLTVDINDSGGLQYNVRLIKPGIIHHGSTTPAIDVRTPDCYIFQPGISLQNTGAYGVRTDGSYGFGLRIHGGRINGAADACVRGQGSGTNNQIHGLSALSAPIGLDLDNGWTVKDCDTDADTGIRVGDKSTVSNNRFENGTTGIVAGPSDRFTDAEQIHIEQNKFVTNYNRCIVWDSVLGGQGDVQQLPSRANNNEQWIEFKTNAAYVTQKISMWQRRVGHVDNGFRNTLQFEGMPNMTDANRGDIAQPHEGMAIFNVGDGLPNYYDGTDWVLPDGTTT